MLPLVSILPKIGSLSARRAWIEIFGGVSARPLAAVALRKESVDRNTNPGSTSLTFPGSLSARRAWIEINVGFPIAAFLLVALRKESVDRNTGCKAQNLRDFLSRSPQGERG